MDADLKALELATEILRFVKSKSDDDIIVMAALEAARIVFSRRSIPESSHSRQILFQNVSQQP
jgi:hypothetical protein